MLTTGDVIVSIDGKRVRDAFDLSALLDARGVGDTVELGVLRGVDQAQPEELKLKVVLKAEEE
jgi:S1-C subfamily serine protease